MLITEYTSCRHDDQFRHRPGKNHLHPAITPPYPGKQLGLKTTSLKDYTLDTVRRRLDGSEAVPSVDVREMRGAIVINFRTGAGCDNISYDSLLPLSFLKV